MLQLEYKGSFLMLAKGSAIEIEKNSPLFLIDTVLAEYTMPITILYNDQNVSLLGDVFFDHGIKAKIKIPVNIYDNGTYFTAAILVIDKNIFVHQSHSKGNVQGYLLTGISDFFNTLKNKKLSSLMLGGIRRFNFTTWEPFDSSDGWWQHFHDSWNNTLDFVMIPHRNESWIEESWFSGWVNQLGRGYLGGVAQMDPGKVQALSWPVLFPRLKYVLEQLFIENGWTVDFSGLGDTSWQNLFLFNTKPVQTTQVIGTDPLLGTPIVDAISPLNFQLSDFISPELLCTEFLLAICKRYGWAPICDSDSKSCRMIALKQSTSGTVKDFTKYAAGTVNNDFSGDQRVFDFTNQFPSNDAYPSAPDFTNFIKQPAVASFHDLPAASMNFDTSLIFCFLENAYYKIEVDASNNRIWVKHSDNIYDVKNDNASDTFDTICSTLPVQLSEYRETFTGVKYYGFFPICKQPRNKQWGLRTIYYHGMAQEITDAGMVGGMSYPLASSVAVLPNGTIGAPWSNVYVHNKPDGTQYGLIAYWWKIWIDLLKVSNIVEIILNLPIHELSNLQWDDIINIKNQPYLIKKYIEPHPYKGSITATLHPMILDQNDPAVLATTTTYYVRLYREDPYSSPPSYFDYLKNCSIVARVFSDAAGTVLVAPDAGIILNMVFKAIPRDTGIPVYGGAEQHSVSRAETVIFTDALYEAQESGGGRIFDYYYELLDYPGYIKL